jgi:crotonyl-CoA carboxylase/reductase
VPDYLQKTAVREIMHRGVITCALDTPLKEVARIMNATDVHALFIVDERDVVLGVVSHMDMLRAFGQDLYDLKAQDIMTTEVHSISPEAPVPEAVQMMLDQRVHRLLVARREGDEIIPVGIISTTDVIDAMWGRPWLWERPASRREEE